MPSSNSSESEDESFLRVNSQPSVHLVAPEDIDFKVKMKSGGQRKSFLYTLKKDQKLPYEPELEGL